ncbi:hypothetical protein [Mycobacterium sp. E802]|uniref:hypothetical protein n=1 Tax=Mycobacterium sp. E802 TaxID=1834152 RepID=UPI0012FBFADD|nr:hypothetical protein [Mycobacterium sp. E802]
MIAIMDGEANVNALDPGRPETLERLSGTAHTSRVPVCVQAVRATADAIPPG